MKIIHLLDMAYKLDNSTNNLFSGQDKFSYKFIYMFFRNSLIIVCVSNTSLFLPCYFLFLWVDNDKLRLLGHTTYRN